MKVNGYKLESISPEDIKPNDYLIVGTFDTYGYGEAYKFLAKAANNYSQEEQLIWQISLNVETRNLENIVKMNAIHFRPYAYNHITKTERGKYSYTFHRIEKRFIDDIIQFNRDSIDDEIIKLTEMKTILNLNVENLNANKF